MFVIAPAHLLYLILQCVQVSPNNFQPWNPSPRDSLHCKLSRGEGLQGWKLSVCTERIEEDMT